MNFYALAESNSKLNYATSIRIQKNSKNYIYAHTFYSIPYPRVVGQKHLFARKFILLFLNYPKIIVVILSFVKKSIILHSNMFLLHNLCIKNSNDFNKVTLYMFTN
jgi:hypothetical protein